MSRRGVPPGSAYGPARPSGGAYGSAEGRTGVSREDTEAFLAARQDLGKEYEPALVDAFLERLDHAIDARVQARVDAHMAQKPRFSGGVIAVPFASLLFGIPLSAIAGGMAQLPGLLLVWSAIVVINVAYAVRRGR